MRLLSLLVLGAAFVASALWLYFSPGWEPGVATIAALGAFVAALVVAKKNAESGSKQVLHVKDGSIGVQAGGNVSIGEIKKRQ